MYTYGRFIYDENTKEILHYNDGESENVMFLSNGLMMPYQISNMVNCGVYLFTVQDLYTRYYFTYFNIGTRSQFTKTMQKSIKEY